MNSFTSKCSCMVEICSLMVFETFNSTSRHRVMKPLERYCLVSRKQRLVLRPYQAWSQQVWELAQLFAFLLPAEPQQNLPWAYNLSGQPWTVLALLVRPDYLLQTWGCSARLLAWVYATAVFAKMATVAVMALVYGLMEEHRFELVACGGFKGLLGRMASLWDRALSVLLLKWLLVPGVLLLAKEFSSGAIIVPGLLTVVTLAVLNRCYLGTFLWNEKDIEAALSWQARTFPTSVLLASLLACSALPYSHYPAFYSAIQIVSGVLLAGQALLARPYYKATMNAVLLGRGVVLGWGGLCTFLGYVLNPSQSSILATALFFLVGPFVFFLLLHRLLHSSNSPMTISTQSSVQDLQLKVQVHLCTRKPSTSHLDEDFHLMFSRHLTTTLRDETQLVLLALLYYQWQEDDTFVQVNLSKLQKLRWPVFLYMDCCYAVFATRLWLMRSAHLAEAMTYMDFESKYRHLLDVDWSATETHWRLFTELARKSPQISRVTQLAYDLDRRIAIYKDTVREMNQKYKQNRPLLRLLSDFYQELTNSQQALRYSELLIKAEKQQLARNYEEVVDYYSPETMVMAISLEESDFGHIVWTHSAELLGYTDSELQGKDHSVLIPPPIHTLHMQKLRRIALFRHHHPVYANVHGIVFMQKNGVMLNAYWKVRLVNAPDTANLVVLCALKKRENAPVVAFVDDEGLKVTAMVIFKQTQSFRKQLSTLLNRSIPLQFPLGDLFGTGHSQWKEQDVCLRGLGGGALQGKVVEVRCADLNFYGLHRQKCLQMVDLAGKRELLEESEGHIEARKVDFANATSAETVKTTSGPFQSKSLQSETLAVSMKSQSSVFTSFRNTNYAVQVSFQSRNTGFSDNMRQNVRKQKQRLAFLLKAADRTLAVLFLWTLAMFTVSLVVQFNVVHLSKDLQAVLEQGRDVDLAVRAALHSKELVQGVPGSAEEVGKVAGLLQGRFAELHRGELGRAEREEQAVWWEFDGQKAELIYTNAVEIIGKFATRLLPLAQRLVVNSSDIDFLTIYRNGAHEGLTSLNRTMYSLFQASTTSNEFARITLSSLAFAGVSLLLLCCVALAIVVWLKVRALRSTVWSLLRHLPAPVYASARANSSNRLQFTHKIDLEEDQKGPISSELQAGQISNISALPELKLLLVALVLLGVLFAAGLAGYFADTAADSVLYGVKWPQMEYISGLKKAELSKTRLYLNEVLRPETAFSQLNLPTPVYSNREELAKAAANLANFHHFLIFRADKSISLSTEQFQTLFQGSKGNSLDFGAHSLLLSLYSDIQTLDISDQDANSQLQNQLKSFEESLGNMTESYKSLIETKIKEMKYEHVWEIVLICGVMLAYYVLIVRCLVRRIVRKVGAEWGVLAYIPREACPDAIKILRHRSDFEGK